MSLVVVSDPTPLQLDADGVVRVGGTRVTLDVVVQAFQEGAAPETIADQYPALALAAVYGAIAFYLRHREDVEAYLEQRKAQADKVRADNERQFPPSGVRQRLLARQVDKD
jgi:uncharacterized protein (DUF433 family)